MVGDRRTPVASTCSLVGCWSARFVAAITKSSAHRGSLRASTSAHQRRKPGVCTNTLTLPVVATDEMVLRQVEGEALSPRFIDELLSLVDRGEADTTGQTLAERDRLRAEVSRLVASLAAGVSSRDRRASHPRA